MLVFISEPSSLQCTSSYLPFAVPVKEALAQIQEGVSWYRLVLCRRFFVINVSILRWLCRSPGTYVLTRLETGKLVLWDAGGNPSTLRVRRCPYDDVQRRLSNAPQSGLPAWVGDELYEIGLERICFWMRNVFFISWWESWTMLSGEKTTVMTSSTRLMHLIKIYANTFCSCCISNIELMMCYYCSGPLRFNKGDAVVISPVVKESNHYQMKKFSEYNFFCKLWK